jgi:signal peptidase I
VSRSWKTIIWATLIIGSLVAVLRVFLVRVWVVPSDDKLLSASIAPSLAPGDVVLLLTAGGVGFSDLVRCTDPDEPRRYVIGRVAAESGDTIVIQGANVVINEKRAALEHACSPAKFTIEDPNTGAPVELQCSLETLGGATHKRGNRSSEMDGRIERQVPAGFVWLLSDNRTYPNDSRLFGAVRPETCDARIIFRFWSSKGYFDSESRFTYIH